MKPQGTKRSFKTTSRMPLKVEEPIEKKEVAGEGSVK